MNFILDLIRDTIIAGSVGAIFGIIVKYLKGREKKKEKQ